MPSIPTNTGRWLVRAVIDLAANLGLTVVAEGVETLTAWKALAGLGCAVAQGYILSPPIPASQFATWVMARAQQLQAVP